MMEIQKNKTNPNKSLKIKINPKNKNLKKSKNQQNMTKKIKNKQPKYSKNLKKFNKLSKKTLTLIYEPFFLLLCTLLNNQLMFEK